MTKSKYPKIHLGIKEFGEGQFYCDGPRSYAVEDLWEAAKDLPVYEIPLIGIATSELLWDQVDGDFLSFLKHAELCNQADLSYPVILDVDGNVADGRHRIGKAIMKGLTKIKIQRLVRMPEPTYVFDEGEDAYVSKNGSLYNQV